MARTKSLNFGKLNAELFDADAAINPLLAVSNITEISVNGKPVPAADAPLADRINALARANPPGADAQPVSFALEANAALAKENEEIKADNVRKEATIGALTKENATLKQERDVANANVQQLTATNAQLANQLDAAIKQYSAKAGEVQTFNAALSTECLAAGCLTLIKDGKALPSDAPAAERQAAAEAIPWNEKLTAYKGAVHSAVARVGVPIKTVPTTSTLTMSDQSVLNRLDAITDPRQRAHFYKENEQAILSARRAMRAAQHN